MAEITGFVAPGFERVREEFAANFDERGDVGAGFSLYRDGQKVIELYGGVTEAGGSVPYGPEHLQLVFSSTKGATALLAHILAERGDLDFDDLVVDYWPEFGAKGKDKIPVSWLLTHESGLIDIDGPMSFEDAMYWDEVIDALSESTPAWEPGTARGYHAITFGYLIGEVMRRATGRPIGPLFAEEVARPLGLDFWIGLPESQYSRVVPLITPTPPPGVHFGDPDAPPPGLIEMLRLVMGGDSLLVRALSAPGGAFGDADACNRPEAWGAEVPSANGITNAPSLARMYAAMIGEVDGVRLISEATLKNAIEVRTSGPDHVMIFDIPFGLGFMRDSPFAKLGSPNSFGHYGAGGSVGFADPVAGISFGYVMNKMELGIAGDPRTAALIDAVYACL